MTRRTVVLSTFQLEALQYVAAGHTARTAADMMGKSYGNVLRALHLARQKLGVHTTPEAVEAARRDGYPMRLPQSTEQPAGWVREWQRGDEFVEDWRGVPWHSAPLPAPEHQCRAQTRGIVRVRGLPPMPTARCACGAGNVGEGWEGKNSRSAAPQCDEDRP